MTPFDRAGIEARLAAAADNTKTLAEAVRAGEVLAWHAPADLAACLVELDAKGEEIKRLRAELNNTRTLADISGEVADDAMDGWENERAENAALRARLIVTDEMVERAAKFLHDRVEWYALDEPRCDFAEAEKRVRKVWLNAARDALLVAGMEAGWEESDGYVEIVNI